MSHIGVHNSQETLDSAPSLFETHFPKNYWWLQYRRLQHDFFGDTLLAGTNSNRDNKYAKLFVKKFGWSHAFNMAKKGDSHEALSMLFQRDGMPPKMIVGGSKEQTMGIFKRKVAEASCYLSQKEP